MTQAQPQHQDHDGHHWKEPDRVRDYVDRKDREAVQRNEVFRLLTALVPAARTEPLRVLDIGCGYGPLATVVLDEFPHATAVGLDLSEAMMQIGSPRMARFGARFRYLIADIGSGLLPDELPDPLDLVVSSLAVHHLHPQEGARLYRSIYERLAPNGSFFNIDHMGAGDDYLQERYSRARECLENPGDIESGEPRAPAPHNHERGSVAVHLEWLRSAGFQPVDCFWKRLNEALVGGFKPA